MPTPDNLLYFYLMRPRDPISWLFVISRPKIGLLDGFTQSFKNFKDGLFRVCILATVQLLYYDDNRLLKFPFYWTKAPARLDTISKDVLDADNMRVVDVLEKLPTRVSGKWVVCCYLTDSPAKDL